MARKCDRTKYKRRRARELQNRNEREARQRVRDRQFYEARRIWHARRQAEWDADPRRLLMQRLTKILRRRLYADPIYQITETMRVFGGDHGKWLFS